MEFVGLVAGVMSVILGGFAVWLSVQFYRWSNDASAKIEAASQDIAANVKRLDSLFDRMYSDTFALVRDSYDDMRKSIWENQGQRAKTEPGSTVGLPPVAVPPQGPAGEVEAGSGQPERANEISLAPRARLRPRVLGGDTPTGLGEVMSRILARSWEKGGPVTTETLLNVAERGGFSTSDAVSQLFKMHAAGEFYVPDAALSPSSRLFRTKEEAKEFAQRRLDELIEGSLGDLT